MQYIDLVNTLKKQTRGKEFIEFSRKIIKTNFNILGCNMSTIKKLAKRIKDEDIDDFVPNEYFETNFIYVFIKLRKTKTIEEAFYFLKDNISLIDSWALTDSTYREIKITNFNDDLKIIKNFINSEEEFLIRYGFLLLFNYLKDKNNLSKIFSLFIESNLTYVYLVEAWIISYLFIYYFEETYQFILTAKLDLRLKLKSISKALESYRVDEVNKIRLKSLRKIIKSNQE